MNKQFKGTDTQTQQATITVDTMLSLINAQPDTNIESIMHKEATNMSMNVADSSADQAIHGWTSSTHSGNGIDALMHYLTAGAFAEADEIHVMHEDILVAEATAKELAKIYADEIIIMQQDAEIREVVDRAIESDNKNKGDDTMNTNTKKKATKADFASVIKNNKKNTAVEPPRKMTKEEAARAKAFFSKNSGALANAKQESKPAENKSTPKTKTKQAMPTLKEGFVQAAPEQTRKQQKPSAPAKMPGLKEEYVSTPKPSKPAPQSSLSGKMCWYTNPKHYPVLNRFNQILDNIEQGAFVDPELGVEKLVVVKATDIPRYASRPNVGDYLFIIQIRSSGVVLDFPIKRSNQYKNAALYSESITFTKREGKLHPVFMFTHPNGIQVSAQCTNCDEIFRGNTTHLYCPHCQTHHGKAEVTMSHPELELKMGHKFAREEPESIQVDKEILALVMAVAQFQAGLDMGGVPNV